jgi:penicillin amidase
MTTILALAAGCGDDGATTGAGGSGGAGGQGQGGGTATDGVRIDGLSGEVKAVYDEHGLLHLGCASDDDCYAALGYFHAQNRFFFMDFVRNLVRGRLGSLVRAGDIVLERDYANRQFFATAEGQPLEEKLYQDASAETRGHLDAYSRGVNAWLADLANGKNGASLTTEYDFALIVKDAIRAWEPEDSAAVGLYVLNDLSNNADAELALAEALAAYANAGPVAQDLFDGRPLYEAYTKPLATLLPGAPSGGSFVSPARAAWLDAAASLAPRGAVLAGARGALRGQRLAPRGELPGDTGSNNWALGPGRTTSGNALVANDPHLSLLNPSIWFPVEIDAKSNGGMGKFHTAGSTFPGLPAIMVGHNEDIGWGVTTAYWDLSDVYLETLTPDGKSVLFNGQPVAIVEKSFSFVDASTNQTVEKSFRWVPHHGPIVSEDPQAGTAVTIKWVGHAGGTDLDGFYAVGKAASVEEAKAGIEQISAASQNFVVADKEGHIGWFPFVKLPRRSFASAALPPWLPLPGDGSAEWDGVIPTSELPQLFDPPGGAIATANQDMTGASFDGDPLNDGQAALQAWPKADGARQQRILDLLAAGANGHGVDTMTVMQADTYSLLGNLVASAVLDATANATLSADEQALVDALAVWDGTCPTGVDGTDPVASPDVADAGLAAAAIGCTVAHAALYALVEQALGDEIAAVGTPVPFGVDIKLTLRALKAPTSLTSGDTLWDDVATTNAVETKTDIVLRSVAVAASGLASLGEPNAWRWGRVHTLTLRSIFDSFGIGDYNDGPHAAPGGLNTVNVAGPMSRALPPFDDSQPFAFASGPSVRFVVEARPEGPRMVYQLPGGTDLHRESPFYNNLLPNWLVGAPIEFPFGPDAVPNPAIEVLVKPAGG